RSDIQIRGRGWDPAAAFIGNGRFMVIAGNDNFLGIIDLAAPTRALRLASNTVEDIVASSEEGRFVVSGNALLGELNFWVFDTELSDRKRMARHSLDVVNILTVLEGSRFVTTSTDWTAMLWQRSDGEVIKKYDGVFGYAKGLAKTVADDRFLIGFTFKIALYDAQSSEELFNLRQPPCDGVTAIAMSPSGRYFVTGSSDGVFLIFSETFQILGQLRLEDPQEIVCIAISDNEERIVFTDVAGHLTFIDMRDMSSTTRSASCGLAGPVFFSPDSTLISSGTG